MEDDHETCNKDMESELVDARKKNLISLERMFKIKFKKKSMIDINIKKEKSVRVVEAHQVQD